MANLEEHMNIQQTGPQTFKVSCHDDWVIGTTIFGGCVAAQIHYVASTFMATDPKFTPLEQPDIMALHIEFLRACVPEDSIVTITPLKLGGTLSTLQLQLHQNGKLKAVALVTTTNFDKSFGPSIEPSLEKLTKPKPDLEAIQNGKADAHWMPTYHVSEMGIISHRILNLVLRGGSTASNICDVWSSFNDNERMNATYLALMADFIPSMADTLLSKGSLQDYNAYARKTQQWCDENPGVPAVITQTIEEVMKNGTQAMSVAFTFEFKKRLPKEGLRWLFIRSATKMLRGGRLDVDVAMCNEDLELVCTVRHLILVVDISRKFSKASL